jgi:hypothetical protein
MLRNVLFLFSVLVLLNCKVEAVRNCNCIAFRLDDLQDGYVTLHQRTVIETFQQMNTSLTAGIIANQYGADANIVPYVQSALGSQTNCFKFEIANHGWNHEEFPTFTLAQQTTLLTDSQNKIQQVTGVRPETFIPPYNEINANTYTAASTTQFKYLTSEVSQDPPPYDNPQNGIMKFPILASTGELTGTEQYYAPANPTKVWNDIQTSLTSYGFAVVMMHPYEFSDWDTTARDYKSVMNQTSIQVLIKDMIVRARAANIRLVTINEINDYFNASKVHPCNALPATTGSLTTAPLTTSPLTTSPLTTSPLTTAELTTAPLTTGEVFRNDPSTTGQDDVPASTTGSAEATQSQSQSQTQTQTQSNTQTQEGSTSVEEIVGVASAIKLSALFIAAFVLYSL